MLLLLLACAGTADLDVLPEEPVLPQSEVALTLPGAEPHAPALMAKLDDAWSARPDDYAPRTRHLEADGSPTWTNRLFLETSPYLRQHAHNPVNWYPWGDEAFEAARERGVPVFLSVGYSTCHWCHVMEEESFEDPEIAAYLNEHYVAIKVDREERPDVDSIYMSAVTAVTGRGGWPMSVWLTPDRLPFYGGTYFPPRAGVRGSREGFIDVLGNMSAAWSSQRDAVVQSSERLAATVNQRMQPASPGDGLPGGEALSDAVASWSRDFDPVWGGLDRAPKFPSSLAIRALLRSEDPRALEMASLTLEKMAAGGMYDHVAGGFHRYSTDREWLTPHFEKMLYDNAQLAVAYLEGWQATGEADFTRVSREILDYVLRDMAAASGAFYSATDADSMNPEGHSEEGWYFTWTPAELAEVLGETAAARVGAWYGVTEGGNFEGRTILNTPRPLAEVAAELEMTPEGLAAGVAAAREALYQERSKRPAPIRDEKILAGWNGLMISAFARAGLALDEPRYTAAAAAAAGFALDNLRVDGRLLRTWKDGQARHMGVMEDHAFLAAGLLDLFEATGERRWLAEAMALDALVAARFEDAAGGWFRTADDAEVLLVREKPWQDRAVPSGGSVHTLTLLRLYALTGDDAYRARAHAAMTAMGEVLERSPTALSELLLAVDWAAGSPREVILVTPGERAEAAPFLDALRSEFLPHIALIVVTEAEAASLSEALPPLAGKSARDGAVTAYVCEQGSCQFPTTAPGTFIAQLR